MILWENILLQYLLKQVALNCCCFCDKNHWLIPSARQISFEHVFSVNATPVVTHAFKEVLKVLYTCFRRICYLWFVHVIKWGSLHYITSLWWLIVVLQRTTTPSEPPFWSTRHVVPEEVQARLAGLSRLVIWHLVVLGLMHQIHRAPHKVRSVRFVPYQIFTHRMPFISS